MFSTLSALQAQEAQHNTDFLQLLPYELLNIVINSLDQQELVALSYVNRYLNRLCNIRIYRKIILCDDHPKVASTDSRFDEYYSCLPISHMAPFANNLTASNFSLVHKLIIHSQSNFIVNDYSKLYVRFFKLWDLIPSHNITFINFDIGNLRHYQSINQFVFNNSTEYLEDDCVSKPVNLKINNLKNWTIFNFDELFQLPYNRNLQELDIFIENESLFNTTKDTPPAAIPAPLMNNLATLQGLYLNSPISTAMFLNYFNSTGITQLDIPLMRNMSKLSITSSHTHWYESRLTFESLSLLVDINQLDQLELKLNCLHHDCDCILQFFNDLQNAAHGSILRKLSIINYKSNNLRQNLYQFNCLLSCPDFLSKFESLESLYLNINDFIRLDSTSNHAINFSIQKLINTVSHLPNLQNLVIPDFFNNWLVNLPDFFHKMDGRNHDSVRRSYFDTLLNQCECSSCCQTRFLFNSLSSYDSNNNYKHEFKSFSINASTQGSSNLSGSKIGTNKSNINFLNYLISKLKQQFKYLNQNLFLINSIINSNDKPFLNNDDLVDYNRLFLHNCLYRLVDIIKRENPKLTAVNLGGVLVEFDGANQIRAPYHRSLTAA